MTSLPFLLFSFCLLCTGTLISCQTSSNQNSPEIEAPSAYTGEKPYIALCYARKNKQQVYPLIEQIQAHNYRLWYDEGIPLGVNWENEVAHKLAHAQQVIFILSPEGINSHWLRRELSYCISKNKQILPVMISTTKLPEGWHFLLASTQTLSVNNFHLNQNKEKIIPILSLKAQS